MDAARRSPLEGLQLLTTYEGVQAVLRSSRFAPATHLESAEFVGDTVLVLHGDEHFARRRLEVALFAKEALQHYERDVLAPVIERCLDEVAAEPTPDGVVRSDLVALSRTMLIEIAAAVVGLDGVEGRAAVDRLVACLDGLIEATLVEWSTRDHADVLAEGRAWKQAFVEEFVAPSRARRAELVGKVRSGELAAAELPRDLITLLLQHWQPSWDDDLLVREANLYLVAATLTTSTAVTHAVADLTRWFADHPEDAGLVDDPDFLRRASSEVLRLHVPSPALLRRAEQVTTIEGAREVAPGEVVGADLAAANRDPAVFGGDVEAFDPWRELPERVHQYGHAFGGGPHICIGRPLAMGTYAAQGGDVDGLMVLILRRLYAAGVVLDPDRPAVKAASAHDRYTSFPVVLTRVRARDGQTGGVSSSVMR